MDWLSDAWSGVKSFFSGGQSDEEKRRKAEEAKRKAEEAARQKQQQQAQKPTITVPTVVTQPSQFAPQQQPWTRSTADALGLNKKPEASKPQTPKPEAPKPQAISPQDRKLIQGIRGYHVMSPTAQKQALEKARSLSGNPPKRQVIEVADPMRDAFHQNPTQPSTAPAEQRMAQVQANTLNKQVDEAKEQAKVGLQRAKAPSVEEYNKMNPNAQRQYIKTLEAYRDNQDIRTLNGRSEVARINEALGKIQEEGESKIGNLPTLLTDLVQGMGDYIGDSALRRGAMDYQDIRRKATGETNPLGLTPDDVKGVNEAYLRGEIGYDDLVRTFRNSPQLYNLNARYKIGKDKGIETIDSELERAGTIGKDAVSGALTALSFAPIGFSSNAASLMGRFASRAMQGGTFNVFADLGSQAMNEAGYERTPEEMFQDGVMTFVLGGLLEGVTGGRGVSASDTNAVRKSGIERIKQADPQLTDAEAEEIVNTAIKRAEDKKLISRETENADQAVIEKSANIAERSETTPQPEGTIRLYQGTEGDVPSPNYFDNIGQLEDYYRFRSDGVDFNFVDVPTNQVQRVPGAKGEAGVFEIKPDEGSVEGVQRMLAKSDEPKEVITEVQTQAAQQAEGGQRNRGISAEEIMERYRERSRVYNEADPETKAEIDARARQTNPDDVSFESPWSREAVYRDLTGMGLTPEEIANLTNRYDMTAQDWRAVMNATGNTGNARSLPALFDSQIRKVLNKQRVQQAPKNKGQYKAGSRVVVDENGLTRRESINSPEVRKANAKTVTVEEGGDLYTINIKENAYGDVVFERYDSNGNFMDSVKRDRIAKDLPNLSDEELAAKSVYGTGKLVDATDAQERQLAERFIDTPEGRVDTMTGEIIDTPPAGGTPPPDLPPTVGVPPVDAPPAGSLADDISNELADVIKRYTDEVRAIGESIRKLGFDPDELRRKMTLANRGEYNMTPDELAAESLLTSRYNQARQKLAESGLEFDGEQLHYTPQVRQGEANLPTTREELTNFGYARGRKNAMDVDELDFGDVPTIDYLVRAENRSLVVQESMARNAEIDGRPLTREGVQAAADDTIALQKKIAEAKGSEKVLNNDTVAELNNIGKNEGYTQVVNNTVAGRISQEPLEMLNRAGVYDSGFRQYDNTVGYANEFTRLAVENNVPTDQLGDALTEAIRAAMPNAEASSVREAVSGAMFRIKTRNLNGADIAPQVAAAYRSVAKAELFRLGKTTKFTDPKMKAVVNEQINARLLQDNYSKNFAQELDTFIAQRINASLRGANVVSAAFELGDIANILSNYGVKNVKNSKFGFGKVDGDFLGMSKRYGEADQHFLSNDIPEVNKLNEIWSDESTNLAQKVKRSYEAGENKLLIFRYVEQYKTELFFRQADAYWRGSGLEGQALVNQVQQDYLKTMLPNKIITANRLIGKMPKSLTQYLNWSVQATKRLGRTLAGTNDAGVYRDMSRGSRVVRGVSTELLPKVVAASVLGVPIMQVMGMRDWTGTTDGDFTGISDEDKTALDVMMSYVSISPLLGVASNVYFAGRREQEAVEDGEEANEDWLAQALGAESTKLIPFYTQFNKSRNVQEAVNDGYFQNKDGRVQFAAPEVGSLEHIMGLITGKTYMQSNRDYQDSPDIMSVLRGEASLADLFSHNQSVDNFVQAMGGDTARDYSRPVSDNDFVIGKDENGEPITFNFNQTTKDAFANEGREAGINRLNQGGAYNEPLDALRRDNPKAYEAYQNIMNNDDLVSPEYWSELIGTNSEGGIDLTLVKMIGDRKRAVAAASNRPLSYDPMYDLPDDQLRAIVQYKSTATGDDIALRNILNKSDWYKQYKENREAYYNAMPEPTDNESRQQTERVKQWNTYSDQLDSLTMLDTPELQQQFPVTAAYNRAQAAYEEANPNGDFYEDGGKAFYQTYGDQLKAEKAAANAMKLEVINQMRVIEGYPPMGADQYAQATEIASTSGSGGGGGGGGGGGSREFSFIPEFYNSFRATDMPTVGTKPKVAAFNPNTSVGRRTNSRKTVGARSSGRDNGGYSL